MQVRSYKEDPHKASYQQDPHKTLMGLTGIDIEVWYFLPVSFKLYGYSLISTFYGWLGFVLCILEMNSTFAEVAAKYSLEKGTVNNIEASPQVKETFLKVVEYSALASSEKKVGNLLYGITTKLPVTMEKHRKLLAELVGKGGIYNGAQLDFVIDYLKKVVSAGKELDEKEFNEVCGIGKPPTMDDLAAVVRRIFGENKQRLEEGVKKMLILDEVKKVMPYAEGLVLKETFDRLWDESGYKEPAKEAKPKKEAKEERKEVEEEKPARDITDLCGREMSSFLNTKELLEQHEKEFGSGVYTRFPPEPNGYLHIGHAKAMRFNFKLANHHNGHCYLRFDDTNPEKECQEYIDNIEENISFLGYKPWKITHASDTFEKLYEFAVVLIKKGKAFVCGEPKEVSKLKRAEGLPSKDRDRPIEENLKMFEKMRLGCYEESEYCLRAKIDPAHPNTTLRDPVFYRIRYTTHPHSKDKWCIYPLYDYTHPINDSLEGITNSLCTLEFEIRRELYYWPLEQLNLYRPAVWEYSRLNISNTVLSKRKLHHIIFSGYVNGWDDPRVLTINGMKRRGYTADAINNFCDVIGVTRRGNENIISMNVLENEVRKVLDVGAPRTMAIIEPILLEIEDFKEVETKQIPDFPKDPNGAKHSISTGKRLFVDKSDVREVDSPSFYGIAPGKRVGLKYSHIISVKSVQKDNNGNISRVIASIDADQVAKPKSFIHWISADEATECETRIYGPLFLVNNPNEYENFVEKLNPESVVTHKRSLMNSRLLGDLKILDRLQFERKGFFAVDYDSDLEKKKVVWNLTVSLVQDKDKEGDEKPREVKETKESRPKEKKAKA